MAMCQKPVKNQGLNPQLQMNASFTLFFILSLFQATLSMKLSRKQRNDQVYRRIYSDPTLTVQEFDTFLNSYVPTEGESLTDWIDVAIRSDRIDIAFAAYKRGFRMRRFRRDHKNPPKALRELALKIETERAQERAKVFQEGSKIVNDITVPLEVMKHISEYAKAALDVNSAMEDIFEPLMPCYQVFFMLFLAVIVAAMLPFPLPMMSF